MSDDIRRMESYVLPDPSGEVVIGTPDEMDALRARVAELEALIKYVAHHLRFQTPHPGMEHSTHGHNTAVLEIRKRACRWDQEGKSDE